jgi:cytochrome c-type biogenesis protein CcmH
MVDSSVWRWRPSIVVVLLGLAGLLGIAAAPQAAGPVDIYAFDSPAEEQRFRQLIAELRCPKCLNTNLAGSDAPIAADLRRTVYRLIREERMSDAEILAFLQERYGDFVLYNPPVRPDTWILWFAPVGFLLIGILVLWRVLRQPPSGGLSAEEADRVRSILGRE